MHARFLANDDNGQKNTTDLEIQSDAGVEADSLAYSATE